MDKTVLAQAFARSSFGTMLGAASPTPSRQSASGPRQYGSLKGLFTAEALKSTWVMNFMRPGFLLIFLFEVASIALSMCFVPSVGADWLYFQLFSLLAGFVCLWIIWTHGLRADITRLKRTERELIAAREAALAASQAKSDFLSSMSHEIRTPMNAILGMADLLAETALNEEQRRFVETMTSNGNALLELIDGILDLAKVESGRLHLEETAFDLDEVVEGVAETLSVRAHRKGLELAVRVAPDVPLRRVGDPLRLRQVLINLAGNAMKFTERGEVVLSVENEPEAADGGGAADTPNRLDGQRLRFSVRDTGIGIAPEKCEAIFQSFTQADLSTTRRYGGSGLGLAISRRLVELMGGRIWVESTPGCGSIFHFTARLKAAELPRAAMEQAPFGGVRALVVDDNASVRAIVREILEARGAEVAEAEDGEAALRALDEARGANRPVDLMVVDWLMPAMKGCETVRRARAETGGEALKVVMLTPGDRNPVRELVSELGLAACIPKPARRAELYRAVARALRAHHPETRRAAAPKQAAEATAMRAA